MKEELRKTEEGHIHGATIKELEVLTDGGSEYEVPVGLAKASWGGYYLVGKMPNGKYIFSKDITEKERE